MARLTSKAKAQKVVKEELHGIEDNKYSIEIIEAFNKFHAMNIYDDYSIEQDILAQDALDIELIKTREPKDPNLILFNPSGASKCPRELFYKLVKMEEDKSGNVPFQKRWTRNSTAVHKAIQRDLLYMDKYLSNYHFRVARAEELPSIEIDPSRFTLPAWENNILTTKMFSYGGYTFAIRGMMDGNLIYKPEKKLIGFEIKTKSTTIASVGDYKLRTPMDSHIEQCVCYSLLFRGDPLDINRVDTFIIFYESVAKDQWSKGKDARPDLKAFEVHVNYEDRIRLLDKFATVCEYVANGEIPVGNFDKCLFCGYKNICQGEGANG